MRTTLSLLSLGLLLTACTSTVPTQPQQPSDDTVGDDTTSSAMQDDSNAVTVEWAFTDVPAGADGVPYQTVTVTMGGAAQNTVGLGQFAGSCSAQGTQQLASLGSDIVAGALCWWAGGGDQLAVERIDASTLQVVRRPTDEGIEGSASPVQPWTTVGSRMHIPSNATIELKGNFDIGTGD